MDIEVTSFLPALVCPGFLEASSARGPLREIVLTTTSVYVV
jgi:hypothetical protein